MPGPHSRDRVETIVEKAEYVEACLEILASKQSVSRAEFRAEPETRDVEGQAPRSNAAAMRRLDGIDVLTEETADAMAQAALFRNVLAHEYGDVLDQDIVYESLQDLRRYRDCLAEVRSYLDDVGAF